MLVVMLLKPMQRPVHAVLRLLHNGRLQFEKWRRRRLLPGRRPLHELQGRQLHGLRMLIFAVLIGLAANWTG
jgi:hypothetical protein